jgi:N-acylneuraminate cytidylyltransferase
MRRTQRKGEDRLKFAALIPMKGHSERVPNKNLREFCGRPLCHWIVETLRSSKRISQIVIDTDSEEIAQELTGRFDVTIIERPECLQGDFTSVNRLIEHDISIIKADLYIQTHCTNPLLKTETIDKAFELLLARKECDSLFSVTRLYKRLYWEDCRAINHDPEVLLRTQDLPPIFEENSNMYIFSQGSFAKKGRRIGPNPMMFEMDPKEAWDIDEASDFLIAEQLMKLETERLK